MTEIDTMRRKAYIMDIISMLEETSTEKLVKINKILSTTKDETAFDRYSQYD